MDVLCLPAIPACPSAVGMTEQEPPQILPGLFIGNFKDARDVEQLSKNNITHILSIHDSARPMLESEHDLKAPLHSACEKHSACAIASEICGTTCVSACWRSEPSGMCCTPELAHLLPSILNFSMGMKYLCIPAADSPSQNLARHFRESIKFIHECRLTGEGCLVHCLAGVSRSVTLVVAYIMTITDFGWEDALSVVRAARSCANPNMGFQRQLQEFEKHDVDQFRQWLKEEYGENSSQDLQEAKNLLSKYKEQAELHQTTGGRQWNNNFSSVPSLSYSNYTTET
ncbi:PREDICTED: dual specificity protein phosphatase 22 isoform X2 [Ficedula albicollis]|uniref:dual specificity protein phosphatase 22 isoform X2 n=1 Tax=Ficedula albicollis TaxID=59894 RepID=UPI000359E01E|nr:PREDICTED: dual specificity protein phosphatase 22 isoform X2 [Ficedula albicollis]